MWPFFITGFSSGLPLLMLVHQLPAWLTDIHVSLKLLAGFAILRLPYSFKYLWAPWLDHTDPLSLGRRRSWMVLSQLILIISIPWMAYLSPQSTFSLGSFSLSLLMLYGFWIAFWGATQDIVLDAYRQEVLSAEELGQATGLHVGAYRLAVLIPGSLALVLNDHYGWPWSYTFYLTSIALIPGLLLSFWIQEPDYQKQIRSFHEMVIAPFSAFYHRWPGRDMMLILLIIMLYKIGDGLASQLMTPFYRSLGYSFTAIGVAAKQAMLWGGIAGSFLSSFWMGRLNLVKALLLFGVAQTCAIGGMFILSRVGALGQTPALSLLISLLIVDALGMALGTAALTTLLSRLTDRQYTASQFALLSSIVTLPQIIINTFADRCVSWLGWSGYFGFCMLLSLPALLILMGCKSRFERLLNV
jgi:MFS transporter, PAT family, beta-lactamase induction signal transducer AmpG